MRDKYSLILAQKNGNIINSSNIVSAGALGSKGQHTYNTYIESGDISIACSEPERIKKMDLIEEIKKIKNEKSDQSNVERIIDFTAKVEDTILQNETYSSVFRRVFKDYSSMFLSSDLQEKSIFRSFMMMSIFSELTGLRWLIVSENGK